MLAFTHMERLTRRDPEVLSKPAISVEEAWRKIIRQLLGIFSRNDVLFF